MCWWKSVCVRGVIIASFVASAQVACAESILRLDHAPKKATVKKSFSVRGLAAGKDVDQEPGARFVLGAKKQPAPSPVAASKKKPLPPVEWNDKHAKKVDLKLPKGKGKTPRKDPPREETVQWALPPTPMAASSTETVTSVPAPQSLWAGLGLIGAMGIWKRLSRRAGA